LIERDVGEALGTERAVVIFPASPVQNVCREGWTQSNPTENGIERQGPVPAREKKFAEKR